MNKLMFLAGFRTASPLRTEDGLMQNQQIAEDKTVEYFRKAVNEISLSTIAKGIYNFDETQLNTLQSIANTCPLQGGQAVYKARAILSSMEHAVYDDKVLCDAVNLIWQMSERPKPNTFVITPNPATNIATVWFEKDMPEAKLSLIDSKGILLSTQQITQGTRSINLPLEELPSGVYIARLEQINGVVLICKLVVLKD